MQSLVTSFKKLTPNITGIARKNENSAAASRESPRMIAPKIVAPERDVPGTIESTWKRPMRSAVLYESFEMSVQVAFFLRFSIIINAIPYIISVALIKNGF